MPESVPGDGRDREESDAPGDRGTMSPTTAITHSGGLVVAAFLAGILLSAVGVVYVRAAGIPVESPPPGVNAGLTALQFVGFLAVGYLYLDRVADRDLVFLRWPTLRDAGWVVAGLVGLYAFNLLLSVVLANIGVDPASNQIVSQNRDTPVAMLYLAVVSILFVAPGEELLFRGLVQGLLRRAFGVAPALVAASAVFGVAHVGALIGGPGADPTLVEIAAYLAIAGGLGLILGAIYERTKSLVVPIVIHGLWNAYQFLLIYGLETGAL